MLGFDKFAEYLLREVPGQVIGQIPKAVRGAYHGLLGSEKAGEILKAGVEAAEKNLSDLVSQGADEATIKLAREAVKKAGNPGVSYHASRLAGGGARVVGKSVSRFGKSSMDYMSEHSSAFKEVGEIASNVIFENDEAGRHVGNLFTGKKLNDYAIAGAELAGIGILLGTMGDKATQMTAEQSQPGNRMPQLSYGGGIPHDHLGADGDLALSLHYNRHG